MPLEMSVRNQETSEESEATRRLKVTLRGNKKSELAL